MRDSFREWNLYHKSIVVLISAMVFGVIVRAVIVFDTAFEVSGERTINASAETVWALLSNDENRDKWQAEIIDLVELTGPTTERGATRLVFWKHGAKRWQSVERTRDLVIGRQISLLQNSDLDTRWVTISLDVISPCKTKLNITEIIEPGAYEDRFWFFNQRTLHESRLSASFDAMERWATATEPNC